MTLANVVGKSPAASAPPLSHTVIRGGSDEISREMRYGVDRMYSGAATHRLRRG